MSDDEKWYPPSHPGWNRPRPREGSSVRVFIAFWCVLFLLNLLLWVGIIYVAVHFITKFW